MGKILGELTGTNGAARDGIRAQTQAANQANATQLQMYNQNREDNAGYRTAGAEALTGMQDPSLSSSFTADQYQASPGYQFQMDEGMKALQRSAAAKGGLMSGGTMKALTGYAQGVANQDFQQGLSNFKNDQNQRFGQLSQIANMGLSATGAQAQNATNYANQVGQTAIGLGNATAAAGIGATNANNQMLGQVAGSAAAMFSDARLKTNVEPIPKTDLQELRTHLKALKFDYTHEVFGGDGFYGVMAQDLEKSKLGKTVVFEDEFGNKKIDGKRAMSLFLASMAEG